MDIGKKIKLARVAKGWTQDDLAEKINKTRGLISQIELTGKANNYTLKELEKVLNISFGDELSEVNDLQANYTVKGESIVQLMQQKSDSQQSEIATLRELVETQKKLIMALEAKGKKKN